MTTVHLVELSTPSAGLAPAKVPKLWDLSPLPVPSDARACAVMISAYSLGQVINDVSDVKYNNDDWIALVDLVLDRVFS